MRFKFRGVEYLLERQSDCFTICILKINGKTGEEIRSKVNYYTELENVIHHLFNNHVLDNSEKESLSSCVLKTKNELKRIFGHEI